MEQVTDVVGNPIALLIERIFWLGLGSFLGFAIITSLIRGLNENSNKTKWGTPEEKKKHAKKAIKRNNDMK